MHIDSWQWVAAALACGYVPALFWARAAGRRAARQTLDALSVRERILSEHAQTLVVEVESARAVAQDERARRERYFLQISAFETQRDEWQSLYYKQSIGHGNAQELMISWINVLAQKLQAHGVRVSLPAAIQAVRNEFMLNHEMPSRAGMEALSAKKAPKTEPATPTESGLDDPPPAA